MVSKTLADAASVDNPQQTKEGDEVVTVSRNGTRMAKFRNRGYVFCVPVWITAVYVAVRRSSDGVLTWRLSNRVGSSTAGKDITGPMIEQARAYAERNGLPYLDGVRQNQMCD